jgi:hypothetical protein
MTASLPNQYLIDLSALDDHDAVGARVDDAHCDLLQIAIIIDLELCQPRLGSTIKDIDDLAECADVGGCTRRAGDDFSIKNDVVTTHDEARDAVARRITRVQILTDERQPAWRVL